MVSEASIDSEICEQSESKRAKIEEDQADLEKQKAVQKLRDLLNEVSVETQKAKRNVFSKDDEVKDHCISLKTKIDAQSEVLIEQIRHWNEEMRNRIDEYQKQCLDKFNADLFEADASRLKSLLNEMSDHQERIQQELDDAKIDTDRVNETIREMSSRLNDLKKQDNMLTKQKFLDQMLELEVKEEEPKIDLSKLPDFTLKGIHYVPHLGLDRMHHLKLQDIQPKFEELVGCFINPATDTFELIALIKRGSYYFVKMDKDGQTLKKKAVKFDSYFSPYIQTVKDCFILQNDDQYYRFDYDFNKLETEEVEENTIESKFAANQRFIIDSHYDYYTHHKGRGPTDVCFYSLDYSTRLGSLDDQHWVYRLAANDKHLFLWTYDDVKVFELEYDEANQDLNSTLIGEHCSDNSNSFEVKLLGDEYVAVYDLESGKVRLFTQDGEFKFLKEYDEIKVDGEFCDYRLSSDKSSSLCFFSNAGDIYYLL